MNPSLEIASIGMVTAVGLDAPSACAAMRARLDGFQETGFLLNGGKDKLVGAPVPLPRKWIGEQKMARLAAAAISEAFASAPEARGNTVLILCIAEEQRVGSPVRDAGRLLRSMSEIIAIETKNRTRVIAHGRPSGLVALDHARKLVASGEAENVMIVGVDSYLTSRTISSFLGKNRLLCPDNANGFIPGEAAAAILCRRASRRSFGLYGLGLSREKATIYNPEDLPLRGDGMTAAYDSALGETGIEMNNIGYRIADLIGEQYWFKQSTLASLRLLRGRHDFQDIWSPTESLGNVGAAVVPLMIGMGFQAARKGYAAGNPVLVEASNDDGACGAAILAARAA
jgi:3-oxoacyl-[acyl-carrier-protein] synthase-1